MIEGFTASGTTILLLSVAAWLSRTWIKERLTADLRLETESKLEELKAQLSRTNETLSTLTSAGTGALEQVQTALLPHKIKAIQKAWTSVLAWQKVTAATTFAAILPISWIEKYATDPSTKENFEALLRGTDHLAFHQERNDTEIIRPFLSPRGWALYYAYHSFHAARLTKASVLLLTSVDHAAIWKHSDERNLIQASAPPEVLEKYDVNMLAGTGAFLIYLKEQMIEEFHNELSGNRHSREAVANATTIIAAADQLGIASQKTPESPGDAPLGNPNDS